MVSSPHRCVGMIAHVRPSHLAVHPMPHDAHREPSIPVVGFPRASGRLCDESVVREAAEGSKEAWDVLYALYNTTVIGVFLSHRVPRQLALELAQEVWIRLISKARNGQIANISMPGLLVQEAWFRVRDHWRRNQRNPIEFTDTVPDIASNGPDSQQQASVRVALAHSSRFLMALTPRQREVLVLRIQRELGFDEIANQLNISLQRVRQLFSQARQRMRIIRDMPPNVQFVYLAVVVDKKSVQQLVAELQVVESVICKTLEEAENLIHGGNSQ